MFKLVLVIMCQVMIVLSPTTPGDDSPYEFINDSFDDSMFVSLNNSFTSLDDVITNSPVNSAIDLPMNTSSDVNMDSSVNSPGDVLDSPDAAPSPDYIEVAHMTIALPEIYHVECDLIRCGPVVESPTY